MLSAWCLGASAAAAQPQSDARQRQAAAEAYDQGTSAYVANDFDKAAEWFETANRLSPAPPALIQAARAHKQAGHLARAATLGLRLTLEYASDEAAVQAGQDILDELSPKLLRVEVTCDGCALDVDGALQESKSFFTDPDSPHTISASFETGDSTSEVRGAAGDTQTVTLIAPPAASEPEQDADEGSETVAPLDAQLRDESRKPLTPVYTYIGAGLTGALLIGSIVSTIDMNAGVDPYKKAAGAYQDCVAKKDEKSCTRELDAANAKFDAGAATETRSTVLWVATGVVAVATGVIALFLTEWSGDSADHDTPAEAALNFQLVPSAQGLDMLVKGSF